MENDFLSYEEFCDKYPICGECPLYIEDSCNDKYRELLANGGKIVFDLSKEMKR